MKFYLAIAFALLMATAYGIRNKEDNGTGTAADTTDSTTATDDTTPMDKSNCQNYPYEYDNGSVMCTSTSEWCDDGSGVSTSNYNDTCGEESSYISECDNTYDPVDWMWSSGDCTSTSCYSGECSVCSNDYNSSWTEELSYSYYNNECVNADGSTDCKLLAYIFFFFVFLNKFLLYR
jgi:hypothetical protein